MPKPIKDKYGRTTGYVDTNLFGTPVYRDKNGKTIGRPDTDLLGNPVIRDAGGKVIARPEAGSHLSKQVRRDARGETVDFYGNPRTPQSAYGGGAGAGSSWTGAVPGAVPIRSYSYTPSPQEKALGKAHQRLFWFSLLTYVPPTAYVALSIFVHALPISYPLMPVLLAAAIFLFPFLSFASDSGFGFAGGFFLLALQSLIFMLNSVFRLNGGNIYSARQLYVWLVVFLVLMIAGIVLGKAYGKSLRSRILRS